MLRVCDTAALPPLQREKLGYCQGREPGYKYAALLMHKKLSLVCPTGSQAEPCHGHLRDGPPPYLAENGEEGLLAGWAAPLLDVVTVLEEDVWALAIAACLGQTGHL